MKKELFKKITDIRTLWKAWKKVKEKNTTSGIEKKIRLSPLNPLET